MRKVTLYPNRKDTLALSVNDTTEANLVISTHSGVGCLVDWGDGNVQMLPSGSTVTHVYTTNFTGDVLVTPLGGYLDISEFESTGLTAWFFDLGVFVPLTGLTFFILQNLPNALIYGGIDSFSGATGLVYFRLQNLPNVNIIGSIDSFSGATGLVFFRIDNLPNANITGSIDSFYNAIGLYEFSLYTLPNANITGSLNSFTSATGLTVFYIGALPNANITGSLNSFAGATGLIDFRLYNLPSANITGDSSAFANMINLREFLILTSSTSNIVMNYDDILNIWQSSVYIIHWDSGISATKATTSPFNFDSMIEPEFRFQGIGLSTQSMDNMIIALDNSLITQSSPKVIYLNNNAPHSGSPAVMTALSNLASKNITVVL